MEEQTKNQTQEQEPNQAPKQEPKAQQPKAPKQEPKTEETKDTKSVDPTTYKKYTDLNFLQLSGAKLKEDQTKDLQELEKELKSCTGRIAKKTVRAAIFNEHALLVSGIPVPENIEKLVVSAGSEGYYFKS